MDTKYNRYYVKIRTVWGINPKKIDEELTTALEFNTPSYATVLTWSRHFS